MAERPEGLPQYVEPDLILDAGHVVEWIVQQGETEPSGAFIWHRPVRALDPNADATPGWCCGSFMWRDVTHIHEPGSLWQLVKMDPLHVEPSIQCSCGSHGHIRGGKWVAA